MTSRQVDGWRAATLRERLRLGPPPVAEPGGDERHAYWASHRWTRTRPHRTADRLAALGTDADAFRALLDEDHRSLALRAGDRGAGWLDPDELSAATQAGCAVPDGGLTRLVDPLLEHYRSRLRQALSPVLSWCDGVPVSERAGFLRALVDTAPREAFAAAAERTLVLELNVARVQGLLRGDDPAERFRSFLDLSADVAFRGPFWADYPVLLRVLTQIGRGWVANATRLASRFVADRAELRERGLLPRSAGLPWRVDLGVGDSHRGGQSVATVYVGDGRVMYKPRPLAVDVALHEVIAALGRDPAAPRLRVPSTVDRGEYGWCEFVEPAQCATAADVSEFYRRLGGLLAVFHALRATDLHAENIVAAGRDPVVVDVETLFDPPSPIPDDPAGEALSASVLRTYLLPDPQVFRDETGRLRRIDMSAIGARAGQAVPVGMLQMLEPGTDTARIVPGPRPVTEELANRPGVAGDRHEPGRYRDELVDGFRTGYRALLSARRDLLSPDGLLRAFHGARLRLIVRPTRVYTRLQNQSLHPDYLRDGRDREVLLDRLWNVPDSPHVRDVVQSEIDQMGAGDVPLFEFRPRSTDLAAGDGTVISDYFSRRPYDSVFDHLLDLDDVDRERQERVIDLAMATLGAAGPGPAPAEPPGPSDGRAGRLLDAATAVGERLLQLRVDGDGTCGWLGLRRYDDDVWTLEAAGLRLDHGLAGIGLFLGRLGVVTGRTEFTGIAAQVADNLALRVPPDLAGRVAGRAGADDVDAADVGLFGSAAGTLCLLSSLGTGMGTRRWHAVVDELAGDLVRLCVGTAGSLAVADGAAGAVLGLLACVPALGRERASALAGTVADHLVEAWRAGVRSDGDGIVRGPIGVALAMSALCVHRPLARYRTVARDALSLARAADPAGWSLRGGVAGVGMAADRIVRDGSLPSDDLDAVELIRRDTRDRLVGRWSGPTWPVHHHGLLDGAIGELLALLCLTRSGGRYQRAHDCTAAALEQIAVGPRRCSTPGSVETPCLSAGLAGIGWGLLAAARPGTGLL
ncbi:type 2 lanthipeptide synthetase LanM family protein [Pseudonocardia humida]|uniref:Type 2 lantipeptide synthetase LanM family protein n=1 Tax=Pseudonocardia humida TaxID=2800819 RepID=A0ABT1ADA7_9PSEU|nr:type 2 lanthipeptide synthetase LanM family protein [Pseudonocardia humida]MCO1660983.1 type 2 lantipeptide synthetase LanM family protein [Pseudonocardia humida]